MACQQLLKYNAGPRGYSCRLLFDARKKPMLLTPPIVLCRNDDIFNIYTRTYYNGINLLFTLTLTIRDNVQTIILIAMKWFDFFQYRLQSQRCSQCKNEYGDGDRVDTSISNGWWYQKCLILVYVRRRARGANLDPMTQAHWHLPHMKQPNAS